MWLRFMVEAWLLELWREGRMPELYRRRAGIIRAERPEIRPPQPPSRRTGHRPAWPAGTAQGRRRRSDPAWRFDRARWRGQRGCLRQHCALRPMLPRSARRPVEPAREVLELAAQLLVLEDLVEGGRLQLLDRLERGRGAAHQVTQLKAHLHRLEGVVGDPEVMRRALARVRHLLALLQQIAA